MNWWGTAPPEPEIFSIAVDCEFFYDPYLEEPPGGFAPSLSGGKTGGEPLGSNIRMNLAIRNRVTGNHIGALSVLKEIISDPNEQWKNKTWALDQITSLGHATFSTGISAYLRSLIAANPPIRRKIASVLPAAFLHERVPEDALAAYHAVILNYPHSSSEKQALYGKFVHALYGLRDKQAARKLCDTLRARYSTSILTGLAALQLRTTHIPQGGTNAAISPGAPGPDKEAPMQFSLHQNYPNPFNPKAVISYDLPFDAHATMKVYDLLGKEAMTLLDGVVTAGNHQVTIDAASLASGVYFYRLTAGQFTAIKKFVVMK